MSEHTQKRTDINPKCYADVVYIYEFIKKLLLKNRKPKIGIICGTGLNDIGRLVEDTEMIPYIDVPGFPQTRVPGHISNILFGKIAGKEVMCFQGRFHPYEHNMDMAMCALPIRLMKEFDVEIVILSNACGGMNEKFERGDFMLINDHIFIPGMAGFSPLVGHDGPEWGPKFPSLNNLYDKELREIGLKISKQLNMRMHEGVYAMIGGPNLETGAEIKLLKMLNADVVGMSTCHEAIVARQGGMKIVGLSLITDVDQGDTNVTIDQVLETGKNASSQTCEFIRNFISAL